MKDSECVSFLQWALPRLRLRWPGFRRVRGQVCKRIDRRIHELGLSGRATYTAYLKDHPSEWDILDTLCHISISRFYRDRAVFDYLRETLLPALARKTALRSQHSLRCWSAGCASGEEPYAVSLIWDLRVRPQFPSTALGIVATDVDEGLLARARRGCYSRSSLKELPAAWVEAAFDRRDHAYCLGSRWKEYVGFRRQDIRVEQPPGKFDLVLCRNLVFTYFDESLQRSVLAGIARCMGAGGFLVLGRRESLPVGAGFNLCAPNLSIYRKAD